MEKNTQSINCSLGSLISAPSPKWYIPCTMPFVLEWSFRFEVVSHQWRYIQRHNLCMGCQHTGKLSDFPVKTQGKGSIDLWTSAHQTWSEFFGCPQCVWYSVGGAERKRERYGAQRMMRRDRWTCWRCKTRFEFTLHQTLRIEIALSMIIGA